MQEDHENLPKPLEGQGEPTKPEAEIPAVALPNPFPEIPDDQLNPVEKLMKAGKIPVRMAPSYLAAAQIGDIVKIQAGFPGYSATRWSEWGKKEHSLSIKTDDPERTPLPQHKHTVLYKGTATTIEYRDPDKPRTNRIAKSHRLHFVVLKRITGTRNRALAYITHFE